MAMKEKLGFTAHLENMSTDYKEVPRVVPPIPTCPPLFGKEPRIKLCHPLLYIISVWSSPRPPPRRPVAPDPLRGTSENPFQTSNG